MIPVKGNTNGAPVLNGSSWFCSSPATGGFLRSRVVPSSNTGGSGWRSHDYELEFPEVRLGRKELRSSRVLDNQKDPSVVVGIQSSVWLDALQARLDTKAS